MNGATRTIIVALTIFSAALECTVFAFTITASTSSPTTTPAVSSSSSSSSLSSFHNNDNNLNNRLRHPKQELVSYIVDGLNGNNGKIESNENDTVESEKKLEELVTRLYDTGKGFESDLVDGNWNLVFTKQGKKSPSFQKAVGKKEKAKNSLNVFDIHEMTFSGDITFLKNICKIDTKVKYATDSTDYSMTDDGKIVLRRIGCDIIRAGFKVWKLPRLPLTFLKRKGGYLDFVYMDEDIRVTKGNRGGLFVHFRPKFLEEQLSF